MRSLIVAAFLFVGFPMAARAADAGPNPVTCRFLERSVYEPASFTVPRSRIVIDPNAVVQPPLGDGRGPGMPLNAAFYHGETPVLFPYLWAWYVGTPSDDAGGPSADFSASQAENWSSENVRPDFQGNRLRITVSDTLFGAVSTEVHVDVDRTPLLALNVDGVDGEWAVKVNTGEPVDTWLQHETSRTGSFVYDLRSLGWHGQKSFRLRLFAEDGVGKWLQISGLRFLAPDSALSTLHVTDRTWAPDRTTAKADGNDSGTRIEATTCMPDAATIGQRIQFFGKSAGPLTLVGSAPPGSDATVAWDAEHRTVTASGAGLRVRIVVGAPGRWVGAYATWADWAAGHKTAGPAAIWAVAFDNPADLKAVTVTARLEGAEETARPVPAEAFDATLARLESEWNKRLAGVPRPLDFSLHRVASLGATPDSIARAYYGAWAFLLSNILPPMEENDFNFVQMPTGKASLWSEGATHARASAAWDNYFSMQMLALIGPDTSWSAFQGMMSLVKADGSMEGEGLPTRAAQTAWILYSVTGDKVRLKGIYPALKRNLTWKIADPRWLFHNSTPAGLKDAEFVVHALVDARYAHRIAIVLGLSADADYWDTQAKKLADEYHRWFWDSSTDRPYRLYQADNGHRDDLGSTWSLEGLVVPPQDMDSAQRDSLLRIWDHEKRPELPFMISGYTKAPHFDFAERGLWQYGRTADAADYAEAGIRDVTRAGGYAEQYIQESPPRLDGVRPSIFGAALMIEAALWHGGVMLGDGLPTLVHIPGASGVDNLPIHGEPIRVTYEGDNVILEGPGLRWLRRPAELQPNNEAKTPKWTGHLPVGQQIALQLAVSPTQ